MTGSDLSPGLPKKSYTFVSKQQINDTGDCFLFEFFSLYFHLHDFIQFYLAIIEKALLLTIHALQIQNLAPFIVIDKHFEN